MVDECSAAEYAHRIPSSQLDTPLLEERAHGPFSNSKSTRSSTDDSISGAPSSSSSSSTSGSSGSPSDTKALNPRDDGFGARPFTNINTPEERARTANAGLIVGVIIGGLVLGIVIVLV